MPMSNRRQRQTRTPNGEGPTLETERHQLIELIDAECSGLTTLTVTHGEVFQVFTAKLSFIKKGPALDMQRGGPGKRGR
jgi:hypothetical protein